MDLGLDGRRVVVTGASRGIGAATAAALTAEGARCALVARDRAALDAVAARLANEPVVVVADLATAAGATAAIDEAGLDLAPYPAFRAWVGRVEAEPGFLRERFPYSIDPHASRELG